MMTHDQVMMMNHGHVMVMTYDHVMTMAHDHVMMAHDHVMVMTYDHVMAHDHVMTYDPVMMANDHVVYLRSCAYSMTKLVVSINRNINHNVLECWYRAPWDVGRHCIERTWKNTWHTNAPKLLFFVLYIIMDVISK